MTGALGVPVRETDAQKGEKKVLKKSDAANTRSNPYGVCLECNGRGCSTRAQDADMPTLVRVSVVHPQTAVDL